MFPRFQPFWRIASPRKTSSSFRRGSGQFSARTVRVRISQQPPKIKNHLPSPLLQFSKLNSPLPPGRQEGGGRPRYHVALRTNPNTSSKLVKLSVLSQTAD